LYRRVEKPNKEQGSDIPETGRQTERKAISTSMHTDTGERNKEKRYLEPDKTKPRGSSSCGPAENIQTHIHTDTHTHTHRYTHTHRVSEQQTDGQGINKRGGSKAHT